MYTKTKIKNNYFYYVNVTNVTTFMFHVSVMFQICFVLFFVSILNFRKRFLQNLSKQGDIGKSLEKELFLSIQVLAQLLLWIGFIRILPVLLVEEFSFILLYIIWQTFLSKVNCNKSIAISCRKVSDFINLGAQLFFNLL